MIIDVSKLPAFKDVHITIMSESWILDEFFILFYCAVAISVPILMVLAHNHTPAEYNENTFVGLV